MYGERMDAALQLLGQRVVDHAVAFESALSPERLRYDIKPEMSLAARSVTGMALVQMRFVLYVEAFRREDCEQFRGDDILHSHGTQP